MTRTEFRLAMTTASDRTEAESLARHLVERRLAACVNIVPAIKSIYRWQGKITGEEEHLLLIKTRADLLAPLKNAIAESHSYDCPELLVLDVVDGSEDYLSWLAQSLDAPWSAD